MAWRPSPEQGRAAICVSAAGPVFQLGVQSPRASTGDNQGSTTRGRAVPAEGAPRQGGPTRSDYEAYASMYTRGVHTPQNITRTKNPNVSRYSAIQYSVGVRDTHLNERMKPES